MITVYAIFGVKGAGKTYHGEQLELKNPDEFIHSSTGKMRDDIKKKW